MFHQFCVCVFDLGDFFYREEFLRPLSGSSVAYPHEMVFQTKYIIIVIPLTNFQTFFLSFCAIFWDFLATSIKLVVQRAGQCGDGDVRGAPFKRSPPNKAWKRKKMELFGIFDSSSCSSYSCDVHSGRWSPFYFLKLGQHRREGRLEEKRGKICKRRNLQGKCIEREILKSSICDPLINRLSSARSKLFTVSVKQDTRCVQRRKEGES